MFNNGIILKTLTLKNFLSIGNVTQAIKLDDHGLSLILGHNSDANGAVTKNGAGKTAALQALSYALYGKPLTKIKIGNLINNINQKNMFVTVEFERDGISHRIERGMKPDVLRFYKNGSEIERDNEAKGENRETQHDIDLAFGMSHIMFKHILALNTYTEPFLKEGAAKQREIVEELFGVTQISNRAEHLKQLITASKSLVNVEEANVKATTAANTRIQSTIYTAEQNALKWARTRDTHIASLQDQLAAMQDVDFDAELTKFDILARWIEDEQSIRSQRQITEKELQNLEKERDRLKRDLDRVTLDVTGTSSTATVDRAERELSRMRAKIISIDSAIEAANANFDRLQNAINHPGEQECRTCGQALTGTDHLEYVLRRMNEDLSNAEATLIERIGEKAEAEADIADLEAHIRSTIADAERLKETAAKEVDRITHELKISSQSIAAEEETLSRLRNQLSLLGNRPETLFRSRDEVFEAKHAFEILAAEIERERNTLNPFEGQIESLREGLQQVDHTKLNEAHDLLKHQEYLLKLLTSKDSFIRRKIIDKNLTHLNGRLNYYLNKLGLPHEVVFQSDLSVEITLLGKDYDFAQLSRGENNRVIMATSWAFRDVWESLNHRVNLTWVDELFDSGVDSAGAENALQVLKSFARSGRNIFLVSHRDELVGRIDRTLIVTKENGFTSITEQ